ncbi:uncharacterized protein LOC122665832 [Telopea speciosissima]|uniref:uncharacterized protein LOC122665832 n=1 Tax=Telopea speciosissima TaxID=54955 RepID=UPI001CC49EC6|nr:uncharacterized protein LOC122665832 [Telopea speciosissima]
MGFFAGVSMTKGLMGTINLFMVVMYLVDSKSHHGVEAKKKVEQNEDDLELERQLKILNVPHPLKTIRTEEGDILDCVDIYKQPAFRNPLLKDHKIQMKPSFFPEGEANKNSSATESLPISLKGKECPQGTVPIRRTSKEDLLRARSLARDFSTNINQSGIHFPGQFQVELMTIQVLEVHGEEGGLVHGASAYINVYNPTVEPTQCTSALIWVRAGPNENFDYITAGWTVDPRLYGDHLTRFFTYWSVNKDKPRGCYNTLCTGFVQVDRSVTPSAPLSPVSTIGGTQYVIKVHVYQDPLSRNWWLIITKNSIVIGYWPKNLFPYLGDGATSVSWGGIAQVGSNGVGPPLGNGRFPYDPFPCYFEWMKMVNKDYGIDPLLKKTDITTYVKGKNCYDILYHKYVPERGASLTFGGPGGINCG